MSLFGVRCVLFVVCGCLVLAVFVVVSLLFVTVVVVLLFVGG